MTMAASGEKAPTAYEPQRMNPGSSWLSCLRSSSSQRKRLRRLPLIGACFVLFDISKKLNGEKSVAQPFSALTAASRALM